MTRTMQRRSQPHSTTDDALYRPPQDPMEVNPAQTALATVLQAQADLEERARQLEEGRQRGIDTYHQLYHDMVEAENLLREAQRDDPIARAEAFVNRIVSPPPADLSLLKDRAQATTKALNDHVQLQQAINGEVDRTIQATQEVKRKVDYAIADLLAPYVPILLEQIDQAWVHLRSLRALGVALVRATNGAFDPHLIYTGGRSDGGVTRFELDQPLEPDRVGYPIEETVAEWQQALARLREDADTKLPDLTDDRDDH